MALQFYNTLTRRKDAFMPMDEKNVRMYVCGPTVYDRPHLGNARSVVVYDVMYRLLCHLYGKDHVKYVRNITDVDDKINARAKERGITIRALTDEVTAQFYEDMGALNCLRPTIEPRATEHIAEMHAIIEKLLANGHAYVKEDHVLFDVNSAPHYKAEMGNEVQGFAYGMLSHRVQDELVAGARVEVESYKKNPGDFVLWKPAEEGDDPSCVFDSPPNSGYGKGRPGWHIECSAMSAKHLGDTFDLHGGGADLMFPHHENEIAQSRCASKDSEFARMWVHNGFLTVNGEKMSKSLGNFTTPYDLLSKGVKGEVIRFEYLRTHYRKPADWSQALLDTSESFLDSIVNSLFEKFGHPDAQQVHIVYGSNKGIIPEWDLEAKLILSAQKKRFVEWIQQNVDSNFHHQSDDEFQKVIDALCDDLNTSKVIELLSDWSNSINRCWEEMLKSEALSLEQVKTIIAKIYSLSYPLAKSLLFLGINPYKYYQSFFESDDKEKIQTLIDARIAAKKAKNWAEADRIRQMLADMNITLKDRSDGTTDWRRA